MKLVAVQLVAIVLLCCGTNRQNFYASAAGATNEEIREGVSSLMHSVSVLDDKLGRHEGRERVLGESIRKGLAALQKGQTVFPQLKSSFSRLEERVGQIESMLVAQEEKAIEQQNKLADALEAIYKFMNDNSNSKYQVVNKEDSDEEDVPKKIDDLVETIKELRREVAELKADRASADSESKAMIHRSSVVLQEAVGSKLDEKLANLYVTGPNGNSATDFENLVTEALTDIRGRMGAGSTDVASRIGGSGDKTLEAIEDLKEQVLTAVDKSLIKVSSRIQESSTGIQTVVNDIAKTLTETSETIEQRTAGIQEAQEKMLKNTENVQNLDSMLLQTADNIFDTKKKIELSVHRIHKDVSEMVGHATKDLNSTLMERLDNLDKKILENHLGALSNVSTKIETEMSQVWRQIGIMYQEISSSKIVLDRLQQQTGEYVNGTMTTMDNMKGKVGMITDRMTEVDENLNYLLGRLSLVTQEFNQIKLGLGDALESIRTSFQNVQKTVQKTVGPGPHPIPQEVGEEPDNHLMRKRLIRRRV